MDPSGPRFDHPILWTVTGSHGSNGCLVSALKRHHSTLFPPLYSVIPPFFLTLSQKSLSASSSLWNPPSITTGLFLNPHSLNHSFVYTSLPHHRRTVAAQPRFLPHSLKVSITLLKSQSLSRLCLSPSSPSHCRSSAQISSSLSQSLNHSLVSASLPRCRRNSAQIAAHSLTLISASLPHPHHSSLCASFAVAVVWYFNTSNLFFLC